MKLFEDDGEDNEFNIIGDQEQAQDWVSDIQSEKEGFSFFSHNQFNFANCFKQDEQMNEECDINNNNINIFTQGQEEPNQIPLIIDNFFYIKGEKEKYIEKEDQKVNTNENAQILEDIFKNPEQLTKEENDKIDNHVLKPAIKPDIKKNEVKKKPAKKNKFSKLFTVHKIDSENVNINIPKNVPKTIIFGKNKKKFTFQVFKLGRKRKRRLFDNDNIRKKFQLYVFRKIKIKLNYELKKKRLLNNLTFRKV